RERRRPDRLRHVQGDRQRDGHLRRHARLEDERCGVKAAVLTVSDRVSRGEAEDGSGATLEELVRAAGYDVERRLVPHEADQIAAATVELAEDAARALTPGATGL